MDFYDPLITSADNLTAANKAKRGFQLIYYIEDPFQNLHVGVI